ncbi:hypothetical protein KSS87_010646 [Heliosperma pusillum]|nr:hypothetical protein KSS87_001388 [Heliosperma pusillum]KAH9612995.1 hypothetical protein KSS87_010646 [Heliosperma pusillum]
MASDGTHTFWELICAILLPPLGVCLKDGCCTCEFFICLVLTLLGYIPGIIYAVYVIVVKRGREQRDAEGLYAPLPQ